MFLRSALNGLNFKSLNSYICYVSYLNLHAHADASGASNDVIISIELSQSDLQASCCFR
jgi:hypothetical protein